MQVTKEKDFIEIEYIGRIKNTGQIFDLTNEVLAKKEKLYNKQAKYGARIICLGENQVLKALDTFLREKEVGKTYTLDVEPEQAFGKTDPKLIQVTTAEVLKKQNINPFPGLQINASGIIGIIRSVSAGRVSIDFNHPLASKKISYEVTINRIIQEDEEKVKSLVENMFDLRNEEYSLILEKNIAKIKLKAIIPEQAKKEFKEKAKKVISHREIEFS